LLSKDELVLVISQSGETADTLGALRLCKKMGQTVIGLCNVLGSSVAREAEATLYTQAGPEISVASTKAMLSQMVLLLLFASYLGQRQNLTDNDVIKNRESILHELSLLPAVLEKILPDLRQKAEFLAKKYAFAKSFFYLGRGSAYALALEGALKLKELSYIHAEGYASGEMKHGPIALIDPDFPTFVVAFDDEHFPKVRSGILEVQSRQGKVIALVQENCQVACEDMWYLPKNKLPEFLALPAMQLFSYEMADYLGKDVDQPRNLAKSVTVE
jgi:glucosamine--fructose-6-phosphate aminotransferase (isomerizing)